VKIPCTNLTVICAKKCMEVIMKKIISIFMATFLVATMLVGCSNGNNVNTSSGLKDGATLSDIVDKIQSEIGIAMGSPVDDTVLKDIFGVNKEDIEEYAGQMSMVMTSSDTFLIVKAKEGKVEDVKAALEKRKETIIQGQYLPAEIEKANAGKIYINGNYVALMVLGDTMVEEGQDFDSAKAQEEIKKAEDIVNSFFNK